MTASTPRAWAGLALWGVLALPPARHALEATMALHMLVQIPLLAVAGWLVAGALPPRAVAALSRWGAGGICGLLLGSLAGPAWRLPRLPDAALEDPAGAAARFRG